MEDPQRSNAAAKVGQRFGAYKVGDTIGRGTFAKVKVAYHETTKVRVALKIIPRKVMDSNAKSALKIKREIKIMRVLRHPHITRLYDVVKTKHDIVLVMEYVSGGELFDFISSRGRLDESTSLALFQQLTAAVAYCHRYRVTHRDIKPENIMMEHGPHSIKLSDFGLSSITHDGRFFETSCGTPNYASPEVVSGQLYGGPETDVWSCGVVLYAMLCGKLPFDDSNIGNLFRKIQVAEYVVPSHVSPQARDLLRRMLVVNPLERATIEQVMQHPWLRPNFPGYLLSLHYGTVLETTRFAKNYVLTEDMLDEEVVHVVASRFHVPLQEVAAIVMTEEEKLPSMRAIMTEDENLHGVTRRYPAANYFETFSNVLDSKLWPTPVEIASADTALRDNAHDIYISYTILTQKKQNKLAPTEICNTSFEESMTSLLHMQTLQGYGSLNANALHQLSGNSSFTGSSLRDTGHTLPPKKNSGDKTFHSLPQQAPVESRPPPTCPGDVWVSGYNKVAAPFLPLHGERANGTVMGKLLQVEELPVRLLRARSINVLPIATNASSLTSFLSPVSNTLASKSPNTVLSSSSEAATSAAAADHRAASTTTATATTPNTGITTVLSGQLLQPQCPSTRSSSLLKPGLTQNSTKSPRFPPPRSLSSRQAKEKGVDGRGETALDTLYHVEAVTRFGNDFIRNGVLFDNMSAHDTLKHVYAAMVEEGLLWKVIYDYYFSCIQYPNIKLQVKIYKITVTDQLVDVKVSAQSGMAAYDVAMSLLERLRIKAARLHNDDLAKKRPSRLLSVLKMNSSTRSAPRGKSKQSVSSNY